MAQFATQAALRSHWTDLIEGTAFEVPTDLTSPLHSVVGWLKQASLEVRQVGRKAVNQLNAQMAADKVVIVHFNDVYNIEPTTNVEPIGGALRFCSAVKTLSALNPLVLFSGDCFSPSMLSTFTKGEQMVPVLNAIGTNCAVFGNHDFDFGLDTLKQLTAKCNFPWLMSNVIDNETGRPLGDGNITHAVLWNQHRIGIIGLVEKEWLDTLATLDPDEVTFIDFVQAGTKLATQLKEEGCECVIALTHMRFPNDLLLAEQCENIDLILGGHDHVYDVKKVKNTTVVKSGTDFRQFSKITLDLTGGRLNDVEITRVDVNSTYPEDETLKKQVDVYSAMIEGKMDTVLGRFCVPLEGRFSYIRREESNLGNWVCDVILAATHADVAIINSGTFRADTIQPAGDFTLRDLSTILPMRDPLVVIEVTGAILHQALENSVSKYPSLEGRFPQVAGISFAFDPQREPMNRVLIETVKVGEEYLVKEQTYSLLVKDYMRAGNDGFTMLSKCPILKTTDLCPELGLAIQNHFDAIDIRNGKRKHSKHRQSLVPLTRRHSMNRISDCSDLDTKVPLRRGSSVTEYTMHHRLMRRPSVDDLEQKSCELAPKTENRIVIIDGPEKLKELKMQRDRWEQDSVIKEVDENSPQ